MRKREREREREILVKQYQQSYVAEAIGDLAKKLNEGD